MAPRSVVIDDAVEAHFFAALLPKGVQAEVSEKEGEGRAVHM